MVEVFTFTYEKYSDDIKYESNFSFCSNLAHLIPSSQDEISVSFVMAIVVLTEFSNETLELKYSSNSCFDLTNYSSTYLFENSSGDCL